MPLVIDTSRAFRSPQELVNLVQAVLLASPNDEAAWIEWKRTLPLTDKEVRVIHIVRHILGMANRPVEEAARHAEGCGYIVIGAEPGRCEGVTEIDPADLDAGLRSYLDPDGPRWSAQYVKAQGNSVLVLTVEAPRRGDRNFTLRKSYCNNHTNYHAGMTFVRRPGRTIQAEPSDIRTLEDRFLASDHPITLHIRPAGADGSIAIRPIANLQQRYLDWAARRRAELLHQPARNVEASRLVVVTSETELNKQYEADVDAYISEYWTYYANVAVSRLLRRNELTIPTVVVNTSDRNYIDVRIELFISARATMAGDPDGFTPPTAPTAPQRNGLRKVPDSVSASPLSSTIFGTAGSSFASNYLTLTPPRPTFTIRVAEDTFVVTYDIDRVRAEQRVTLDPFLLFWWAEPEETTLEIKWKLTAGNVDGIARGTLDVTIGEPYDCADILPELVTGQQAR